MSDLSGLGVTKVVAGYYILLLQEALGLCQQLQLELIQGQGNLFRDSHFGHLSI